MMQKIFSKNEEGYILIWIMGIMFLVSLLLYTGLLSLTATMKGTECLERSNIQDSTQKVIQEALWEHYIHALNEGVHLNTDTKRILKRVQWGLPEGIKISEPNFQDLLISPFAEQKIELYSKQSSNPLDLKNGTYLKQSFSIKTAQQKYNNLEDYEFETTLKEIPSTEFTFISNAVFSPKNTTISLNVSGDIIAPGFRDLQNGSSTHADNIFTKFYRKDFKNRGMTVIESNLWESHRFAFSYGLPAFNYFLPNGIGSHYTNQAYIKKSGAILVLFDGEHLDKSIPGISIQEFNKGPNRVVVDPATLRSDIQTVYIYCTSETAVNTGIVVKGGTKNDSSSLKAILSNGRVWLWGNNDATPLIVATTSGGWTFTDSSWKEEAGSPNELDLTWNGYLASPNGSTVFTSPQSSNRSGRLKINGTMMIGGKITGNLGYIDITHSGEIAAQMSPFTEKMMVVLDVKPKEQ